ncbi:MAG TPA: MotA/TolQ/ExbB proton channel family protein [Verrucomicrobiae bacterium]|nr:MotA/TolQ/ExbB proton channel family protein [Verrucomicrobiae bacterium]
MPQSADSGVLVYAFRTSDLVGQSIVGLLLMASVFSWAVMIYKFMSLRRAKRDGAIFLREFRRSGDPLASFSRRRQLGASPLAAIYTAGCIELAFQKTGSTDVDDTFEMRVRESPKISSMSMNSVRSAMESAVGEAGLRLERHLILLATAVSGSPFLGLLGTVWGVMEMFAGLARTGSATMAAIAPGVSAALLTTVTGLVVAIPAMFGYNYLVTSIRAMTIEMDNFAAELAAAFDHRFVDTRR